MRKLIKIVSVFILPILVIAVFIEVMLRNIPNAYQVKTSYVQRNSNTIETLILGSSHVQYGINPKYLSLKALNFANVSQTIDIDYRLLNHLEPKLPNLKNVIVRLSYTTLYEQLAISNESWRLKEYNIYSTLNLDTKVKHQFEILSVKLNANIYRIFEYYIYDTYELNATENGWGIEANSKYSKDLQKTGIATAKKHTIADKSLYAENVDYLNRIIKKCQDNGIRVLLVTTPTYSSYRSNLDTEQLESTIKIGEQMEIKYDNCNYYNLLNSSRFTEHDFFDGDHLNEIGAKKLTSYINKMMTN